MGLKLRDRVFECLKESPEQRFFAREIAEWVLKNYEAECRKKQAKSQASVIRLDSDEALIQQLGAEINGRINELQRMYSEVKTIETRPRKFYYTESSDDEEIQLAEAKQPTDTDKKRTNAKPEFELYQKLSNYLFLEDSKVYSKRIDESKSSNKKGSGANKWLHPDVVGVEVINQNWTPEIKACAEFHPYKKTKLWSFEVKVKINQSNVRECYLQAVTNSSWANFGYLVAIEVSKDALSELRILANLHGIGFIELNDKLPSESQIVIPAKERVEVDWSTANRLADENDDFKNYIKQITDIYKLDEVREKDWDGKPLD